MFVRLLRTSSIRESNRPLAAYIQQLLKLETYMSITTYAGATADGCTHKSTKPSTSIVPDIPSSEGGSTPGAGGKYSVQK